MSALQLFRGLETIVAIVSFGLDFILATPDDPISKPLKLALDLTTFLSVGVLFYAGLVGQEGFITGKQEGLYVLYLCVAWAALAGDLNDALNVLPICEVSVTDAACWQYAGPSVLAWANMGVLLPGYLLFLVFRKDPSVTAVTPHPDIKKE